MAFQPTEITSVSQGKLLRRTVVNELAAVQKVTADQSLIAKLVQRNFCDQQVVIGKILTGLPRWVKDNESDLVLHDVGQTASSRDVAQTETSNWQPQGLNQGGVDTCGVGTGVQKGVHG